MSEEWIEDLLDPNYECGACAIEGQPCDVPAAVLAERERIIKLLEGTDLLKTIEGGALVNYADTAIELIKGEQK